MALKLSQFAKVASPAFTDTLIGVTGGTTDNQYQAGNTGILPANGNITFYVSTTGNDATAIPGNISFPYATGQAAANAACRYDWQNQWAWTIQYADGTYSQAASGINLWAPGLNACDGAGTIGNILGHNGDATKVVLDGQFQWLSKDSQVSVGWLTFDTNGGAVINPQNGLFEVVGDLIFRGDSVPFWAEGLSYIVVSANITVTMTAPGNSGSMQYFAYAEPGVIIFRGGINIVLPASLTISVGFLSLVGVVGPAEIGVTQIQFGSVNWTNFGGVTGPRFGNLTAGAVLHIAPNGEFTDIPGTSNGFTDGTAIVCNFPLTKVGVTARPLSLTGGAITTAMIPQGCWSVIKDTSGGTVNLAYNDAGTIKKVALT